VMALAAEIEGENTDDLVTKLRAGFDALVERRMVNRECGICKSTTLHVQVNRTAFDSLEEARPALEESQRQQLATAEFLRQSRN
jgi:hypothetical protein